MIGRSRRKDVGGAAFRWRADALRRVATALAIGLVATLAGGGLQPAQAATVVQTAAPTASQAPITIQPAAGRSSYDLEASYVVKVSVNWADRRLDVTTDMQAINTSGGSVTRVELNTIAARLGSMHLIETSVNGQAVTPQVSDQTIIVQLPAALAAGGHVWVHTRYRATLLASISGHNWLWSKVHGVASVYRFIPWLSRKTPFDRPNDGDPFVTPVADDVRVTFTSTVPLTFATSGVLISSGELGQTFDAQNVRDFNFTASPSYHVLTGHTKDGKTQIRVVTHSADAAAAQHMLNLARRVIAQYEEWVGKYPYPAITIAETGGGVGMELPAMVWIPRGQAANTYLLAHELGHQWFYAVVGNDQARDPFFDEAMTDFLARSFLHELRSSRCATGRLDMSIYRYNGTCYYETIYIQGSLFIDSIRRTMGDASFWSTVRSFWSANHFTVSNSHKLLEAFRAVAGNVLLPRYRARFPSLYPS